MSTQEVKIGSEKQEETGCACGSCGCEKAPDKN